MNDMLEGFDQNVQSDRYDYFCSCHVTSYIL